MGIVVLWAEQDHRKRAEELAKTYGAPHFDITSSNPAAVANADTLVFWGHGDAYKFCTLDPDAFLGTVVAWRKQNKKVRTVEMISCNLRHRMGTQPDSYTMKLLSKLKRKHADIRLKALPLAYSRMGVPCENSILKWQPASKTWAYVATPGKADNYMWAVCKMLEDRMPPRGDQDGYVRAHGKLVQTRFPDNHKFGKDAHNSVVMEPCALNHMLCVSNNAYFKTGSIGTLRSALVDLK